jgi:large subunit ribosomal protein L7/L12
MAGPIDGGGGAAAAVEQTEFDVVLTGFGDKKLQVVKVVKDLLGVPLMEAKKMVEGVPATLKQGIAKDEANAMKAKIEEQGGTIEIK